MAKWLDNDGLVYLWSKIKELVNANKYTHPTYGVATSGLYKVTVNTNGHVTETVKVVKDDITALGIPAQDTTYAAASASAAGLMSAADYSKLAAFGQASTYALKSDVSGLYKYKGSVASYDKLPASGQAVGDTYNVETDGQNYAWNGSAWDSLGGTLEIERITNTEIDTICV